MINLNNRDKLNKGKIRVGRGIILFMVRKREEES